MAEQEHFRRVPEEWRAFWEGHKREVEEKFEIALEEAERCDVEESIRTYTAAVRMLTRLPHLFTVEIEEVKEAADYLDRRLWNEILPKLVMKLERCKERRAVSTHSSPMRGYSIGGLLPEEKAHDILKCRYCGAPYAYRENLDAHERSCPKRG